MSVSVSQAVNAVHNMFKSNEWKYSFDEEKLAFSTSFTLKRTKLSSVDIRILVRPLSDDPKNCHRIMSYGEISISADSESMDKVCEYLTRANYGLSFGNFELDHRDGEIRYKMGWNVKDVMVGFDALDDLISVPVAMYNKYGNGLLAVSMGMMSPEAAIEQAEKK